MTPKLLPLLLATAWVLAARPARAQLRPLEPAPWEVLDPGRRVLVDVGFGVHADQRAAMAGTTGRLLELGNVQAAWRSGRFAMEVEGTAVRDFHDESRYAPPYGGASDAGPDRRDAGDWSITTLVRLTPERAPATGVLRFGTRLPNSDHRAGLDRDRMDFFALLGGHVRAGGVRAGAEAGLGILGTHLQGSQQSDVLVYTATLERAPGALLRPVAQLTGHHTPHHTPRGNEDLSELRAGVEIGRGLRARVLWVHGLTSGSPSRGVLLGVRAVL